MGRIKTYKLNQNAKEWYFYSAVNTLPPYQINLTSWGFDFPSDPGKVGYLIHQHTVSITQSKLKISGKIICSSPAPIFDFKIQESNNGTMPSNFRFFLWKKGRDISGEFEFDRWWSNPDCVILKESGDFTMEVPLSPDRWSSVFGKFATFDSIALAGFNSTKQNIGDIGITFGGGSFFGHGVRLVPDTGWAKFVCSEFVLI